MKVITNKETIEKFDKEKISNSLMEETNIPEKTAKEIARLIYVKYKDNYDYITANEIREEVKIRLKKRGLNKAYKNYERLGMPVADIINLIENGDRQNANMKKNPETVHKYMADETAKQFALLSLEKINEEYADMHSEGYLHIHDLEYFMQRSLNCLQHYLPFFIKLGLMVDGNGDCTSVAGSPKNIETVMNHFGQILMSSQVNMSGGQSMPLMNIFLAPFVKGLDEKRIKQAVQMLIFNLNMSYTSRGGQAVFSSMNVEFTCPEFLKEEPAYGPGGKIFGVYGDYEKEIRLLQRMVTEVLYEGDALGKQHFFPNTCYSLRSIVFEDPELREDLLRVHKLSVKYSTPYFINQETDYNGIYTNKMGCRTSLGTTWTGDWKKDCMQTGNLAYVTINLPRIAYDTFVEDDIYNDDMFYSQLESILSTAKEILLIRREQGLKCMHEYNLLNFLTQTDVDGTPYYHIENATLSFGFVGINEMLKAMGFKKGILDEKGQEKAKEVLSYFNAYCNELKEETGLRWTVIATPAESTAHRFAMLDVEKYGEKAIVNGEEGQYYYTNSTHVPVDSEILLPERIKIESQFHPLTAGGNIMHLWLGEAKPNAESLMSLTEKIFKTDTSFWAYSSAYSFCFSCKNLSGGYNEKCLHCGSNDVENYDRITGYVQAIGTRKNSQGGWNEGKKGEFKDRFRYGV